MDRRQPPSNRPRWCGSTRYDYVVVRLTREGDDEEGKCELVVKTGTSGVNDAGPEITSSVYEYGLARITVANGASSFVAGNILDVRYNLTFDQSPALRWPSGSNHPQAGDLFYINSAGVLTRLPKSDIGMFLYLNAFSVPDWTSTITAKNFRSDSPTFNPTAGVAAGTGVAVNAARLRGGDRCGEISVTTGDAATQAGILATIEFGTDQPDTNYIVLLTPSSVNAADLNLSITSKAVGSFDIRANVAPSINETLNIQFLVMQVA